MNREELVKRHAKNLSRGISDIKFFPDLKEHATSDKRFNLFFIENNPVKKVDRNHPDYWDFVESSTKYTVQERVK